MLGAGLWAVGYFYLVIPANWETIAARDVEKLERYCESRFATPADLPRWAARRGERILCKNIWYDPGPLVSEYLLIVSDTVEMYVQGPQIARIRDEAYFDNPSNVSVSIRPSVLNNKSQ